MIIFHLGYGWRRFINLQICQEYFVKYLLKYYTYAICYNTLFSYFIRWQNMVELYTCRLFCSWETASLTYSIVEYLQSMMRSLFVWCTSLWSAITCGGIAILTYPLWSFIQVKQHRVTELFMENNIIICSCKKYTFQTAGDNWPRQRSCWFSKWWILASETNFTITLISTTSRFSGPCSCAH